MLDSGLAIASADASLQDYQQHLRMLLAWIAPLEAWLSTFADGPQAHPMLPPLARAALLANDLAHPSMPPAQPMPFDDRPWPARASAAYRWGVCYVVEGSQLGGAVLYQRLKQQLAPHPLSYLQGERHGPGPRWRAFMLALREQVQGEHAIAEACRGARDAFDRILALRAPQDCRFSNG
nr:biliverdin-producing heme oxygenase [Massilia sp. PAMC28688]